MQTSKPDVESPRLERNRTVEEQIKQYLSKHHLIEFGHRADEDTDLFRAGLIDSFGYIQLLSFLESEFHLKISNEELLLNVGTSVAGISRLVTNRRS